MRLIPEFVSLDLLHFQLERFQPHLHLFRFGKFQEIEGPALDGSSTKVLMSQRFFKGHIWSHIEYPEKGLQHATTSYNPNLDVV